MVATYTWAENGQANVTAGGTTAPSPGTIESWTLSSSTLPSVTTGVNICACADTTAGVQTETVWITNISGSTATVVRGAEGTTPVAHTPTFVIQNVIPVNGLLQQRKVDWINAVDQYGADPTGSADSTTAINNALAGLPAGGGVVYLPVGTYKVTAPILFPSTGGGSLRGAKGATQGGTGAGAGLGTVIKPAGTWATSLAAITGVISIINGTGSTNTSIGLAADIRDLWIDCSAAPASVDAIAAWGAMFGIYLFNVGINAPTGNGVACYKNTNFSSANFAEGLSMHTVVIQAGLSDGVLYNGTDATLFNVHAQSCGGDGFVIQAANNRLVNCRADLCVNGFTMDAAVAAPPNAFDCNTLTGCGTQFNTKNGLNVTNTSATGQGTRAPVIATSCSFDGDGVNGGSGGGGYAGIAVAGRNLVTLVNCNVVVTTNNVSTGCPQYALATASIGTGPGVPDLVEASGGFWNAITAIINDAAPSFSLQVSPTVNAYNSAQYVGSATTPPQPLQTLAFLGAEEDNFTHPAAAAVAATMPRSRATTAQLSMVSGTLYVTAFGMMAGTKISNGTAFTNTTVKTGGTHGWYVVLDQNRKVIAVTADQTDPATVWGTASTGYPLAFTAAAIAQYSGIYYFGIMVAESAGTMPTFTGAAAVASGISGGAGIASAQVLGASSSASQTTPPAVGTVMGSFSSSGTALFYAYLT